LLQVQQLLWVLLSGKVDLLFVVLTPLLSTLET
jgi:hypothetical protein